MHLNQQETRKKAYLQFTMIMEMFLTVMVYLVLVKGDFCKNIKFINFAIDKSEEFMVLNPYFFLFLVILRRFSRCCNTFSNLRGRLSVPNKTKNVTLKALNMPSGINERKPLIKDVRCNFRCRLDDKK